MKGAFIVALMRKCDSIYCVTLPPNPPCISQLVYISVMYATFSNRLVFFCKHGLCK